MDNISRLNTLRCIHIPFRNSYALPTLHTSVGTHISPRLWPLCEEHVFPATRPFIGSASHRREQFREFPQMSPNIPKLPSGFPARIRSTIIIASKAFRPPLFPVILDSSISGYPGVSAWLARFIKGGRVRRLSEGLRGDDCIL